MEPNQMGAAGQPVPEPAPTPTPNPMPDMAAEPVAPVPPVPPEPAMNMEAQMTAEMSTEPAQPIAEDIQIAATPAPAPKKKSSAMLLVVALLAIVAIGGVVFGVMMMMQKDNAAKNYEDQIAKLQKTNAQLIEEATAKEALTSDEALEELIAGVAKNQLPYTILNANVTAKYVGDDEDVVSYWVKYTAISTVAPELGGAQYNTIFTQNEDENGWTFEVPGFTAADPKYSTLIVDYEAIAE